MKYITCPKCKHRFAAATVMREWASKGGSVSSEAKKKAAKDREAKKRRLQNLERSRTRPDLEQSRTEKERT